MLVQTRATCGYHPVCRDLRYLYVLLIRSWPETRYARLLSGCRHAGRICWISLTLARYILSTGFRGYSGLPTLELRLRGSWACNGSSWNTPAGFELSKAVPAVMWQMGAC